MASSTGAIRAALAWVWGLWAALWTGVFSYLSLAWLYVRTVLPLWEKEKNLLEWVRRHVPSRPVEDLHRDLTDGVVLCGLLEAVLPGVCPRYDLLARDNPAANLRIASRLAVAFLGVTQEAAGKGAALVQFLRAVRYAALRRRVLGGLPLTRDTVAQTLGAHQVVARGMGLQLGVVGRWARFTLYLGRGSEDGLAVEVRSERGEHGFCRITDRGASSGASLGEAAAELEYKASQKLSVKYEMVGCKARVAWLPLQQARHTLVLILHGRHILGSPYTIRVDESQHNSPVRKRQIVFPIRDTDSDSEYEGLKATAPEDLPMTRRGQAGARRFLSILRRRVVRRVLHIGDHHVVLRGDESIGRSTKARQAFQQMRMSSTESLDPEECGPWESFSPPPSRRRSLQWEDKKADVSVDPIEETLREEELVQDEDCGIKIKEERKNDLNVVEKMCGEATEVTSEVLASEGAGDSLGVLAAPTLTTTTQVSSADDSADSDCHETQKESSDPKGDSGNSETLNESLHDPETDTIPVTSETAAPTTSAPEAAAEASPVAVAEVNSDPAEVTHKPKANRDAEHKPRRRRRKKTKGVSRGILKDSTYYDRTCAMIINMCDFIIKHSPKKEALKTVKIASRIIGYSFSDASDSSRSLPTSISEDLSGEEREEHSEPDSPLQDEVLESVVDEWGATVLHISHGTSDLETSIGHDKPEAKITDAEECEKEASVDSLPPKALVIPEVVVVDALKDVDFDNSGMQMTFPELDDVVPDMDYLQTIDEETEPNSMVDDDRSELGTLDDLQKKTEDYFDAEDKTSWEEEDSEGEGEVWEAALEVISAWPMDVEERNEPKRVIENGLRPLEDVFTLLQPSEGKDGYETGGSTGSVDESKADCPQTPQALAYRPPPRAPQHMSHVLELPSTVSVLTGAARLLQRDTELQKLPDDTQETTGEPLNDLNPQLSGEQVRRVEEPLLSKETLEECQESRRETTLPLDALNEPQQPTERLPQATTPPQESSRGEDIFSRAPEEPDKPPEITEEPGEIRSESTPNAENLEMPEKLVQKSEPPKKAEEPDGPETAERAQMLKPQEVNEEPAHTIEPSGMAEISTLVTESPEATEEPAEPTDGLALTRKLNIQVTKEITEPLRTSETPPETEHFGITKELTQTLEKPGRIVEELLDVTNAPARPTDVLLEITKEPTEISEESLDVTREPGQTAEEPHETVEEPQEITEPILPQEEHVEVPKEPELDTEEPQETTEPILPQEEHVEVPEEPELDKEEPQETTEPILAPKERAEVPKEPELNKEEPEETTEPIQVPEERAEVPEEPEIDTEESQETTEPILAPKEEHVEVPEEPELDTEEPQETTEPIHVPEQHVEVLEESEMDTEQTHETTEPTLPQEEPVKLLEEPVMANEEPQEIREPSPAIEGRLQLAEEPLEITKDSQDIKEPAQILEEIATESEEPQEIKEPSPVLEVCSQVPEERLQITELPREMTEPTQVREERVQTPDEPQEIEQRSAATEETTRIPDFPAMAEGAVEIEEALEITEDYGHPTEESRATLKPQEIMEPATEAASLRQQGALSSESTEMQTQSTDGLEASHTTAEVTPQDITDGRPQPTTEGSLIAEDSLASSVSAGRPQSLAIEGSHVSHRDNRQAGERPGLKSKKSVAIQEKCLILKDLLKFPGDLSSPVSPEVLKIFPSDATLPEKPPVSSVSLPPTEERLRVAAPPQNRPEPEVAPPGSREARRSVKGSVSKFRSMFESKSLNEIASMQRAGALEQRADKTHEEPQRRECAEAPTEANKDRQEAEVTENVLSETNKEPESLKEAGKVSKNVIVQLPKISPDMDLLNQLRVYTKSGSSDEVPPSEPPVQDVVGDTTKCETHTSDAKDNIFSSMQRSIQEKIKMSTQGNRITYSSYVRPAMILLETERRVSRIRSVFEKPRAAPRKRSLPNKSTRYIVGGSPVASPPQARKNESLNVDPADIKGTPSSVNDVDSPAVEDATLKDSTVRENGEAARLLSPEPHDEAHTSHGVNQNRTDSATITTSPQEERDGVTVESHQSTQSPVPLEGELQRKSYKLVAALENMEKDIKDMQESVQRLNQHYPIIPPDDADLSRNLHKAKQLNSVSECLPEPTLPDHSSRRRRPLPEPPQGQATQQCFRMFA